MNIQNKCWQYNAVASSIHRAFLIIASSILLWAPGFGQKRAFWNPELDQIAQPNSEPGWIYLRRELALDGKHLFRNYPKAFSLGKEDEMRLVKVQTDGRGYTHYRFQQYYNGIRVDGGDYIVHVDREGKAYCANGTIVSGLDLITVPVLSETMALRPVKKQVDFTAGLWHNEAEEKRLKEREVNPNASFYPRGELIITRKDKTRGFVADNMALGWRFDVFMDHFKASQPSQRLIIDAQTGRTLNSYSLDRACDAGSAQTPWYGTQTIWTNYNFNGNQFELLDNCTGPQDYTLHTRFFNGNGLSSITSSDNNWGSNPMEIAGGTAHWGIHQARDYFYFVHGRDSWDNNGADIDAVIDPGFNNSYWISSLGQMVFGLNDNTDPSDDWNKIDIVGHEFTHGVAEASAGFAYMDESGALEESFSDIFGELIEYHALNTVDWTVGGVKSLSNPGLFGAPDTYMGTYWYSGNNDNGGVHTNSGVQNYWFYLLSEGGGSTNSVGTAYDVNGIGIDKAGDIAYYTLVYHLNPNDGYLDARRASLNAAAELYGGCSFEKMQVAEAWHAVNVGSSLENYDNEVCGNIADGIYQGIYTVSNSCNTVVSATQNVVGFVAGDEVLLKPGFNAMANNGNYFYATVQPCLIGAPDIPRPAPGSHDPHGVSHEEAVTGRGVSNEIASGRKFDNEWLRVAPNPFSSNTTITYQMTDAGPAELAVYNASGRLVQTLVRINLQEAGTYTVQFDGGNLPPGLYISRLVTASGIQTSKMIIE